MRSYMNFCNLNEPQNTIPIFLYLCAVSSSRFAFNHNHIEKKDIKHENKSDNIFKWEKL